MSFNPEEKLNNFPCTFNLSPVKNVSHQRFQQVKNNVENDFQSEHGSKEENIRDKNLLTWVYFSLNEKTKAFDMNKEVLEMSERKNITALGNLIFLCCRMGDKIQAKKHFEELQNLKSLENFDRLKTEAVAEQAYCYSRMGGVENYRLCRDAFKECTEKCPENYLWKYGLGLVYRRLTNHNLYGSSQQKMDVENITRECAQLMFEVAENGDNILRGLAYAQLVQLKQYNMYPNQNAIFKNMDIRDLLHLALRFGSNNASVLTMCGKSIKTKDINKSIDLLRESINLRENGVTYHHLGLSLLKKVNQIASGRYYERIPGQVRRHLSYEPVLTDNYLTPQTSCGKVSGNSAHSEIPYREIESLSSGYYSFSSPNVSTRAEFKVKEPASQFEAASEVGRSNFKCFQRTPPDFQTNAAVYSHSLSESFTHPRKQNYASQESRHGFKRSVSYTNQSFSERRNSFNPGQKYQKPRFYHSKSEVKNSNILTALKVFAKSPTKKLNIDDELVQEAITCFKKSLEVSHDENVPARLSLADVYLRSDHFQEALSHYNIIIESIDRGYHVSIITAHENAGKCLKKLSESGDPSDSEGFRQEAKEHFIKALSMAADLAALNPDFKTCETKVWDSFRQLQEDIERISSTKERYKQHVKLLELAKNEDIAMVIKEMLDYGLELDDIELFQTGLNSFLNKGDYEEALAFLNMASTKSALTENKSWSSGEVMNALSSTYICTAWARLLKGSPDSRRVFQQMFQFTFGQCVGMTSADEYHDESDKEKHDILVVNDESADTENGPDASTILACNLCQVFKVMFGLDTSRNLERSNNYNLMNEEGQLREMGKYHLTVLILGENDDDAYKQMLQAVHKSNSTSVVVISIGESVNSPEILKRHRFVNIKDAHWQQTQLLTNSSERALVECYHSRHQEMSRAAVLQEIFDGNVESVMRMFCFLVNRDFEKHKTLFKFSATRSLVVR